VAVWRWREHRLLIVAIGWADARDSHFISQTLRTNPIVADSVALLSPG
jgi:hypothetical protein